MNNSAPLLFNSSGESASRIPPIILRNYEEAVGVLTHLDRDEGSLIAKIGPISVWLPMEIEGELRPLLGRRVGVIKTDTVQAYRVRKGPR